MSWGYMFFAPVRLPLMPAELSEETVHSFTDADTVKAALSRAIEDLAWDDEPEFGLATGSAIDEGARYEFSVMRYVPQADAAPANGGDRTLIVKLRCSGRIDSAPFAQRLCDATGWIAFDDRAYLFQPHHPPMPGGAG